VGAVNAVLYNTFATAGLRYTCLGASTISRFYHNSALLLPNGDVLIAGGEQGAARGAARSQPETQRCHTSHGSGVQPHPR
jgi:hypothetical protein